MNPRNLGVDAIQFYQAWLSPLKGFRCAHSVVHGSLPCSEFGKRALAKYGYAKGYRLLRLRFLACAAAKRKASKERKATGGTKAGTCKEWSCAGADISCCIADIFT